MQGQDAERQRCEKTLERLRIYGDMLQDDIAEGCCYLSNLDRVVGLMIESMETYVKDLEEDSGRTENEKGRDA